MAKSVLKFRTAFLKLARDVGLDTPTVRYCLKRLAAEGIQFLTVTLPKLSKAVLRSLELGYFKRPTEFCWHGRTLRFFRLILNGIFDVHGNVKENVDVYALWSLRQLCEYFYKLAFSFSDKQKLKAEMDYLTREAKTAMFTPDDVWIDRLRGNLHRHYGEISNATIDDIFLDSRPRFGPGAFWNSEYIEKYLGVPKFIWKGLRDEDIGTTRKDLKPFMGFFRPYPSCPARIRLVEEGKTCKVIFVPKDSRGPRVISKEPLFLLKAQLSYFDWLSSRLEKVTGGRVNFKDQSTNQRLALHSSIDKLFGVYDMKEASDSVQYRFCQRVFEYCPAIRYALTHMRSTHAVLPVSGKTIRLNKLSGMGSGLTFPTMALLIHLSVCTYISLCTGTPYSEVSRLVYVYGDDLIVPTVWHNYVGTALKMSGFEVNEDKSFVNSHFRESCGVDAYKGNDMTPARLRFPHADVGAPTQEINFTEQDSMLILELERHCRELVKSGLVCLSGYFYSLLEEVLGALPQVSGSTPVLGRWQPLWVDHDDSVRKLIVPSPYVLKVGDFNPNWSFSGHSLRGLASREVCPYKHLARQFVGEAPTPPKWQDALGLETRVLLFGEFSEPRAVKLTYRRMSSLHLNGVPG